MIQKINDFVYKYTSAIAVFQFIIVIFVAFTFLNVYTRDVNAKEQTNKIDEFIVLKMEYIEQKVDKVLAVQDNILLNTIKVKK